MRAFYTSPDGRKADLCLFLNGTSTRLTIRDAKGTIHRHVYDTWDDAITALAGFGAWTNDINGMHIG